MRRSIANKWWLSVWCYLIEDSPTRLLKSDANPNWDLTTNSALICVSQDFLWRNLQSGSSWQTSDSTNSSTNCQLVHGFAASIYFEKARIAFYFIIFHGVSQQRYLRNLTNFRNQANTSRLLCYIFFACMLTNTYQLRWANNWAKEKEELSAFSPSRYFYNILTFINHIRGFDNLFSALGSSSLLPTPSLKLKLVLRIWIWYLRPLLGVFNLFFNWNLDPIFLQGRRSQTKCRSNVYIAKPFYNNIRQTMFAKHIQYNQVNHNCLLSWFLKGYFFGGGFG